MLSHFKSPIAKFPRKMMTFSSNGLISINSKEEIFQRSREADYKESLINGYPEILENSGILIQLPNLILIDMGLSICTSCIYSIRKLDYPLKQTLERIKDDFDGQPTVLWTATAIIFIYRYRTRSWIMSLNFSKKRFQNLFSLNNRYHGYYVSEVFMQFAERYLSG